MTGRVLGIDPSLTATAVASSAGWVETVGEAGKRDDSYPDRLKRLSRQYRAVRELIGSWEDIDLAVIEGAAYSRSDPSAFDRASLWWDLYRWFTASGIPVAVIPPTSRAMYATGRGNAAKGAVIDAAARRWPQYETGGDDNKADAVTLLAMGLDWLGRPLCPMPTAHRKALDKVKWPLILNGDDGACPECDGCGVVYVTVNTPGTPFYCGGCSGYPGILHEPTCGSEPCSRGCPYIPPSERTTTHA